MWDKGEQLYFLSQINLRLWLNWLKGNYHKLYVYNWKALLYIKPEAAAIKSLKVTSVCVNLYGTGGRR